MNENPEKFYEFFLNELKFGRIKREELTTSDYREFLKSVIPDLYKFPSKSGEEGTAYFVGDDFVVKKYGYAEPYYNYDFYGNLPYLEYFSQLRSFKKRGLSVVDVFATVANKEGQDEGVYYLEEKVRGKGLFEQKSVAETYSSFADEYERKIFNEAIKSGNGELYKKIVESFIGEFIETNDALTKASEDEIKKLAITNLLMKNEGRYLLPDMGNGNIMFDGEKFTLIDPFLMNVNMQMVKLDKNRIQSLYDNQTRVLMNMADIFANNINVEILDICAKDPEIRMFIQGLVKENKNACSKAAKRMIFTAKRALEERRVDGKIPKPSYSTRINLKTSIKSLKPFITNKAYNQIYKGLSLE